MYNPFIAYYSKKYPRFKETKNIQVEDFIGTWIQIMYTPNRWQHTSYATATYTNDTLQNIEWDYIDGKLVNKNSITGTYVKDNNKNGVYHIKIIKIFKSIYRILDYNHSEILGSFLVVSGHTPHYIWVLWKPPKQELTDENFNKAYLTALDKIKLLHEIGVRNVIFADQEVLKKIVQKLRNL